MTANLYSTEPLRNDAHSASDDRTADRVNGYFNALREQYYSAHTSKAFNEMKQFAKNLSPHWRCDIFPEVKSKPGKATVFGKKYLLKRLQMLEEENAPYKANHPVDDTKRYEAAALIWHAICNPIGKPQKTPEEIHEQKMEFMRCLTRIQATYRLDGTYNYDEYMGYSAACPAGCFNRMFEVIEGRHPAAKLEQHPPNAQIIGLRAMALLKTYFYNQPPEEQTTLRKRDSSTKQQVADFFTKATKHVQTHLESEYQEWQTDRKVQNALEIALKAIPDAEIPAPQQHTLSTNQKARSGWGRTLLNIGKGLFFIPHHLLVAGIDSANIAITVPAITLYIPIFLIDCTLYYSGILKFAYNNLGLHYLIRPVLDYVYTPLYRLFHWGKKPLGSPYKREWIKDWWGAPWTKVRSLSKFVLTPMRWSHSSLRFFYKPVYKRLDMRTKRKFSSGTQGKIPAGSQKPDVDVKSLSKKELEDAVNMLFIYSHHTYHSYHSDHGLQKCNPAQLQRAEKKVGEYLKRGAYLSRDEQIMVYRGVNKIAELNTVMIHNLPRYECQTRTIMNILGEKKHPPTLVLLVKAYISGTQGYPKDLQKAGQLYQDFQIQVRNSQDTDNAYYAARITQEELDQLPEKYLVPPRQNEQNVEAEGEIVIEVTNRTSPSPTTTAAIESAMQRNNNISPENPTIAEPYASTESEVDEKTNKSTPTTAENPKRNSISLG